MSEVRHSTRNAFREPLSGPGVTEMSSGVRRPSARNPAATATQTAADESQRPEGERREQQAADDRPDEVAQLERRGAQAHVAAHQLRRRQVGDQRVVDRAVDALGEAEDHDHAAERDHRRGAVQRAAHHEDRGRRDREHSGRQGERVEAAPALRAPSQAAAARSRSRACSRRRRRRSLPGSLPRARSRKAAGSSRPGRRRRRPARRSGRAAQRTCGRAPRGGSRRRRRGRGHSNRGDEEEQPEEGEEGARRPPRRGRRS